MDDFDHPPENEWWESLHPVDPTILALQIWLDEKGPYIERQWLPYGVLRAWREVLGWTQGQMVMNIQKSSESPGKPDLKTYQRWEWGKVQPNPRNFLALRQMLLDTGSYWAYPWMVVDLEDFQAVQWLFLDLKTCLPVRWVLVNTRTDQIAQGVISETESRIEGAIKVARLWKPEPIERGIRLPIVTSESSKGINIGFKILNWLPLEKM
jgi:hypothetical protein